MVGHLSCVFLPLATVKVSTYDSNGRRIGHPGVVFVVASSRAARTVSYCNKHFLRAPGVSEVTGRNIHVSGYCTIGTLSNPSETYVLANGFDRVGKFASGTDAFSNGRRAFPGLLRTTNCRASVING